MKKVGIVTIYDNYNFGNRLQNYATQSIIESYGNQAESIIDYKFGDKFRNKLLKKFLNRIKAFVKHKLFKIDCKNKNFYMFQKKFIKESKINLYSNENNQKIEKKYDYFLVGSDQVWNPYFGLKGDIKFLKFSNKSKYKNIAFSASIGINKIEEKERNDYFKGINNIKYVSVREDAGKKIVEDLTGRKDIEVLVDPTMLLTKEEWKIVEKKPKQIGDEKYILNYFLGNLSDERKNKINKLAKEKGYKVINILDKNDPFYVSGPSEFVYLEEHAELICTDSFHSCVFGILMDTPFVVFNREDKTVSMNSRLETLLSKFKLEDRYYKGKLDESFLKCDYSHCEEILKIEREKADKFLRKALDIKE